MGPMGILERQIPMNLLVFGAHEIEVNKLYRYTADTVNFYEIKPKTL